MGLLKILKDSRKGQSLENGPLLQWSQTQPHGPEKSPFDTMLEEELDLMKTQARRRRSVTSQGCLTVFNLVIFTASFFLAGSRLLPIKLPHDSNTAIKETSYYCELPTNLHVLS